MAAPPASPGPIDVFYSYAHEDGPLLGELIKHLAILKRKGVIRDWQNREITAGTEWKGQIDRHLDTAGVILLLVSADFIHSDYCWDVELKRALERHDKGEARVIPVILRHVDGLQEAPFGKLQVAPTEGRPVTDWPQPHRDEAFADVAGHIRRAVEELQKQERERAVEELQKQERERLAIRRVVEELQKHQRELVIQSRFGKVSGSGDEPKAEKVFSAKKVSATSQESRDKVGKPNIRDKIICIFVLILMLIFIFILIINI